MKALALALLVLGCHNNPVSGPPDLLPPHTATLRLSVTAAAQISGVDHLVVTIEIAGGKSMLSVPTTGNIPPLRTFDLEVLYAGTAAITVEARDASEKVLGTGSATAQTVIDQSVDATVTLSPT